MLGTIGGLTEAPPEIAVGVGDGVVGTTLGVEPFVEGGVRGEFWPGERMCRGVSFPVFRGVSDRGDGGVKSISASISEGSADDGLQKPSLAEGIFGRPKFSIRIRNSRLFTVRVRERERERTVKSIVGVW